MRRAIRAFRRSDRGAAAIEIAMIAPIFFAIVFSTFEVGHAFFKTSFVEREMAGAAREVKTGQAFTKDFENPDADPNCPYGSNYPEGHPLAGSPCPCETGKQCFFDDACERLGPFLDGDCAAQLAVEVRRYASFADVPDVIDPTCPTDDGYTFDGTGYDPGAANDIVQLRACFVMKTFSPIFGAISMANGSESGTREVISVQLHRNEPYDPV